MQRNKLIFILTIPFLILLTSCASMLEEMAANQEKAAKVRFISEKESEECEYLGEIVVEQKQAAYGGAKETENRAKERLRMQAVTTTIGGNALRITDRDRTERKGEHIPAKLILYADCFKCPEKE